MAKEHSQRGVHLCDCTTCQQHPHSSVAHEHRRINRLVAAADERTRRLLVGFFAQQHGRGGKALFSRITGLDHDTIARGQRELQRVQPQPVHRIRQPGGGRTRTEKNPSRPEASGRTASGRYSWRPDHRTEMDAPFAPQGPESAAAARHSIDAADDCTAVESTPLQPADQPETRGGHSRS